jgi:hypothetical protein
MRAGNCSGTANAPSLTPVISSVLPSLARNSSSQSNAEIMSGSELISSLKVKSVQSGADFYGLHYNSMLQC